MKEKQTDMINSWPHLKRKLTSDPELQQEYEIFKEAVAFGAFFLVLIGFGVGVLLGLLAGFILWQ